MSRTIALHDFLQLAAALKPTLEAHEVPVDQRDSLLSDIVFHCASFIDEKTGSSFHESIDDLLADDDEATGEFTDRLIAELEIRLGSNRRIRVNLMHSMLSNTEALRSQIEMALGLRGIHELDAKVDIDARLADLLRKRRGIAELQVRCLDPLTGKRASVPPRAAEPVGPIDSLEVLCTRVRDLASGCA